MAASNGSGQLYPRSSLPFGFEDLLNDLVRSVITSQPLDLNYHIAEYLEALVDRRTLWDLQLQRTSTQRPPCINQISNVTKIETEKNAKYEMQPRPAAAPLICPAATAKKRLKNATRNPQQSSPSPEDPDEDGTGGSIEAVKTKCQRPASRKRIRNGKQKEAWTDETVLGSHLAQHEALRQVIKEIGETNEQIIALEETAGNATHSTPKTRNTAQARDLSDKHSSLKRALDKLALICTWIKSNELSDGRAPEFRENAAVEKTTRRGRNANDVNNENVQGTLVNQIDALKETMQQIQSALANKAARGNALSSMPATEQISSKAARGRNEKTNILQDIGRLNQWLQYMFQMRNEIQQVTASQDDTSTDANSRNDRRNSAQRSTTKRQHQNVKTLLETETTSTQDIIMLTNTTTQTKKVASRKQKKPNPETDNTPSSSVNSLVVGKQTTKTPANVANAPQKETSLKLEYQVTETDRSKETRVMLSSKHGESTTPSRDVAQISFQSGVAAETKASSVSSKRKQDVPTDTINSEEAEKAQPKVKSFAPPKGPDKRRRGSVPTPMRLPLTMPDPMQLISSDSNIARLPHTGMEMTKSQISNDSNIANVDSYSGVPNLPLSVESVSTSSYVNVFCVQSISSVSQSSWIPHQTTASQSKEILQTRNYDIQNVEPKAQLSSHSGPITAKTKPTQGQNVDISPEYSALDAVSDGYSLFLAGLEVNAPSSKHSIASNQQTNAQVLSNEVFSSNSIKSPSYATAQLSVQKGGSSMITKENASAASFPKSSSHSTARARPKKGDASTPTKENAEKLPQDASAASFPKSSSHSTAKSSQRGDTKRTIETVSDVGDLPPTVYSSLSFFKESSHATTTTLFSISKADTTPPHHPNPNYSDASFAKTTSHVSSNDSMNDYASAHSRDVKSRSLKTSKAPTGQVASPSTAKAEPKKYEAGPSSKEAVVVAPQANGSTSASSAKVVSNSAAKLSNQKGGVRTSEKEIVISNTIVCPSASFAKSSSHATAPDKDDVPPSPSKEAAYKDGKSVSFTRSSTERADHNVNATTPTKAAKVEKPPLDAVSSPSFTKASSNHSATQSVTPKAITMAVEAWHDQMDGARYVDYTNIFPQIGQMQITPESSNTLLSKNHPLTSSAKNLSKPSQTSAISSAAASTERVKIQKAPSSPEKTVTKQDTTSTEDSAETVFSKASSIITPSKENAKLEKVSIHSTSMSTNQAKVPSKENAKLEKVSIHSTSMSTNQAKVPSNDTTKLEKVSVHSSTGNINLDEPARIHSASTNQVDSPSKDSAKLEKTSIHSTSSMKGPKLGKSSIHSTSVIEVTSVKDLPTEGDNSESITTNKDSGKQVQPIQTKATELQLTAESNNNNIKSQQDTGHVEKTPKAVSTLVQNASQVSLSSFRMPEPPIKEVNESEASM